MGLDIKVDLNEGKMADYAESAIKAELLKSAVKLVVEQFTPERLNEFVEKVLTTALKDFNSYQLSEQIRKQAEEPMKRSLQTPEIQARIDEQVKVGIDRALEHIPMTVHRHIQTEVRNAVKAAMQGDRPRRGY